jgi:two-component system sensor histidine kinase PilS (NtrC family)
MMSLVEAPPSGSPGEPTRSRPGWGGLSTLVRGRLLVAVLALPVGLVLRPDAEQGGWRVMGWMAFAVLALSALFEAGIRWQRLRVLQTYVQLACDLVLVTTLSALTGGRESQFQLFFGLVVITGGLLAGVAGGLSAVVGSCIAMLSVPAVGAMLKVPHAQDASISVPPSGLVIAFLGVVGVLAGVLSSRVKRTREDLENTTRALDRMRLDQDVILRHLTSGVLTVDENGTVIYMNPAAEQVLNVRALALRGQPLATALPGRLSSMRDAILDSLRRRVPRARAELLAENPSGEPLPLGLSTNILAHQDRLTGVVAVFQDLTDVRDMERRMRRSETLAEVGALAAGIAHELRNGLNPISGSVDCLQRELHLEGENAVLMQLIANESARLNRFVTDLLSYSRERDLVLETVDLEEQLAELADTLSRDPRCRPGTRVRFEGCGRPGLVQADREQLRQVWLNVAANAFEAMKSGGTLTLRWRDEGPAQRAVEFEDQGVGIPAEHLGEIGKPFFTTKEGGTGLGVAIAQRIVERHVGSLSFESIPGQGTTVRITLPAVAADAAWAA